MSRLPFELFLALRYLRPKRTFVSVITLISIIGVMLGVAVLIVVISVMTGFDRQLRDRILGFNAHLRVQREVPMKDYASLMHTIASNRNVKAVAPYVVGQVLVETQPEHGSSRVLTPVIRGVDPQLEGKVSVLPSSVVAGNFDVKGKGLLVGETIADELGILVGDHVAVYSVNDFEKWREAVKKGRDEASLAGDYVVKGIFDAGFYQFNNLFVICSLGNAQDMYDLEDSVHGLSVALNDPEKADEVRRELARTLGPDVTITTWWEENSDLLKAVVVEKNVMFVVVFFVMIVAAFGIMSTLITFVVQKTREIGMLKAVGATGGQVMGLFLSQSLMIGLLGVASGYGLGMLAVSYRNEFLHFMRRATGFELFPASIYGFNDLPALVVPGDILVICGGSLLICLLAGVLPAWSAGRLKPVEALRYE